MKVQRIVIVEDENIIALDIKFRLKNLGYNVLAIVASGEEAIRVAEEVSPDLILMDIVLRGHIDGVQAAESITKNLHIPIIFITSYSDSKTLEMVRKVSPYGFLIKPFNENELKIKIENVNQN